MDFFTFTNISHQISLNHFYNEQNLQNNFLLLQIFKTEIIKKKNKFWILFKRRIFFFLPLVYSFLNHKKKCSIIIVLFLHLEIILTQFVPFCTKSTPTGILHHWGDGKGYNYILANLLFSYSEAFGHFYDKNHRSGCFLCFVEEGKGINKKKKEEKSWLLQ